MKALTKQQADILEWARRGYAAPDIARVVGCRTSVVYDQIELIWKKGFPLDLATASQAMKRVNRVEARRIADAAKRERPASQ